MTPRASSLPLAAIRAALLFVFWLCLARWSAADIAAGAVAAALASWASVALLPPVPQARRSLSAMARIALHFPIQSFLAGLDVARRALDPRMPLRPGFVRCPMRLRDDMPRSAFRALMSLQPGSLPVQEQEGDILLVHCLDTGQPVVEGYAREEALFAKACGAQIRHG